MPVLGLFSKTASTDMDWQVLAARKNALFSKHAVGLLRIMGDLHASLSAVLQDCMERLHELVHAGCTRKLPVWQACSWAAYCRKRKSVVVAIRGTMSMADVVTDAVVHPEGIDDWLPPALSKVHWLGLALLPPPYDPLLRFPAVCFGTILVLSCVADVLCCSQHIGTRNRAQRGLITNINFT